METVYYIGLINTWVISLDSMCDAKTLELVKDNFKSRNDIGDAHVVVTGGKFVSTENKTDLMHESEKYDAIPSFEMVKKAMSDKLTDKQVEEAKSAIKRAVVGNKEHIIIDLMAYTPNQVRTLSDVLSRKGYPGVKIMMANDVASYMTIELNPLHLTC